MPRPGRFQIIRDRKFYIGAKLHLGLLSDMSVSGRFRLDYDLLSHIQSVPTPVCLCVCLDMGSEEEEVYYH